jgi:phosphoribosylamine---glycine ligase
MASATGTLAQLPPLQWDPGAAVTVVVAAENYPEAPVIGDLITGIEAAESDSSVHVLHAGTRLTTVGDLVSAGGRVLSIVGQGDDLAEASALAYAAVGDIFLRGSHYRSDIARAAVEGEITVPVSDRPSGTAADATHSGCGGTH